jgi:hypothetical protein
MEKLKFAFQVFTALIAFPVITIMELNHAQQSKPAGLPAKTEQTVKAVQVYSNKDVQLNVVFKMNSQVTANKKRA